MVMPQSSLLAIFSFAFAVSIGAVISPGPVSAAIVTEAPRKGWRAGPLIATGHILLELIFIAAISLGLSTGLAKGENQRAIALGGSLLLFYMGGSYLAMAFQGKAKLPEPNPEEQSTQTSGLIFLGMLTTISNPFWYAWWVTIVPGYLAKINELNLLTIVVFYLGHISVDYLWDTFLSLVISSGRRWLSNRSYSFLIIITGGFMIYLGVLFLLTGLGY
jgi:threonine/homoserine/homoserine lactone efflux protein